MYNKEESRAAKQGGKKNSLFVNEESINVHDSYSIHLREHFFLFDFGFCVFVILNMVSCVRVDQSSLMCEMQDQASSKTRYER